MLELLKKESFQLFFIFIKFKFLVLDIDLKNVKNNSNQISNVYLQLT